MYIHYFKNVGIQETLPTVVQIHFNKCIYMYRYSENVPILSNYYIMIHTGCQIYL